MGKHLNYNNITENDNCYFIDDTQLTNFVLKPVEYNILLYLDDDGTVSQEEHLITMNVLRCKKTNAASKIVFDLKADTRGTKVLNKIPPYCCFYCVSEKSQQIVLHRAILDGVEKLTPRESYLYEKQGYFRYNGIPYYNICDMTFSAYDDIKISNNCNHHLLPYSTDGNHMEWLIKYVNASNFDPLLLLSAFFPYCRHLIQRDSGDDRRFVTYINAPTSSGKTTHMELIVKISDDNFNMFSLSSDRKGLNTMAEINGVPMLIDDFNKTRSDSIYKSNTKKLSDMVGQFQSPTVRVIDEKEVGLKVGFFVTVEELIDNASTINRGIVVELPGPFVSEEMTWLQQNKSLYIGLIVLFIKFLLVNEDMLKTMVEANRICINNDTAIFSRYKLDHKILKTRETLMLTKILFMEFLKNHFKPEQQYIDEIDGKFTNSINDCTLSTFEFAKCEADKEGTEYVDMIAELVFCVQSRYLSRVTENVNYFMKYNPKVIGLYDNSEGCVCFKTEDLLHYFNSLEDFKSKPTVKSIIKQLNFHNLLKYVGGESTYPLSKNKGLGRFVHIKLRDLFICYREHFDLCRSNGNNNDINDFEKQLKEAFILYIAPEAEYEDEDEVEDYLDTRYKKEKKAKKKSKKRNKKLRNDIENDY